VSFFLAFYISKKFCGRKFAIALALLTTRRNTSLGVGVSAGLFSPIITAVLLIHQFIQDLLGIALMCYPETISLR